MQMIRVLVVDDMQPICRRYEKLINQEEDMEVVGLAFSGAEALEMVRTLEPKRSAHGYRDGGRRLPVWMLRETFYRYIRR